MTHFTEQMNISRLLCRTGAHRPSVNDPFARVSNSRPAAQLRRLTKLETDDYDWQ